MIRDWLVIGLVIVVLWAFWWWLGKLFDAIGEYHTAARKARREATSPDRERVL